MKYKLCKLQFQTAVHFGNGMLSSSEYTLKADTLFSALCIEAVKVKQLSDLVEAAKQGGIQFSDAMPYIGEQLLLPKPLLLIERKEDMAGEEQNSIKKKKMKKMQYIPVENYEDYLKGDIDKIQVNIGELGQGESVTKSAIRGLAETMPYHVGIYRFSAKGGLYFIVGYEEDKYFAMVDQLVRQLSFSGIGGKRSAGLGRFQFQWQQLPTFIEKRLSEYDKYSVCTSLSGAMPRNEELESSLEQASYLLEKRSGFIFSEHYNQNDKKDDFHVFAAGSCFTNYFQGDIYDVNAGQGHPVYRYAKPLFMGVSYE